MPNLNNEIFRVVIRSLTPPDLDTELKDRIVQAVFYFEDALKSQFFKDSVLTFNNSDNGFHKRYNLGLNNRGVYQRLINSMEINGNMERYVADLHLNFLPGYGPNNRTVGFVENNSRIIHTYQPFILTLPKATLAAYFAHEWTHLLGFKHPRATGTNNPTLAKTIPYAIEGIVKNYLDLKFADLMIS